MAEFPVTMDMILTVGGLAFIVAAVLLRDQTWLEPRILFFSLIAGVLVSLVLDAFVMLKSRLPYVSDPQGSA